MPTTISHTSKELVERLIMNEFNRIDFTMDFIYGKADKLINLAKEFGLDELSEQLKQDKETY
jgi:hypothetical protein